MTTGPGWLVAAAVVAGTGIGLVLARALADAAYRLDEEADRPVPRAGWLVAVGVPAAWGLLAWRLGGIAGGVLLPAPLLLAVLGVALTRIDLDVHRLPEGLTLPAGPALLGLLGLSAWSTGQWWPLGRGLIAAVATWAAYTLVSFLPGGGLGGGDATVGALVALVLGSLDPLAPVVAAVGAFVAGGIGSGVGMLTGRLELRSPVAFGPYLFLGGLLAALTTSPTW